MRIEIEEGVRREGAKRNVEGRAEEKGDDYEATRGKR